MAKAEIVSEMPISMSDLKKEIGRIKKRDQEPSFRVTKMEEYLNFFVQLSQKDAEALEQELKKLDVPRLKDLHIKKIVDLLPVTVDHLKVILQGYTLTVNQDNMKKIVAVVKKFAPEQKK
ncbi:MAG: hypothetical protein ABIG95_00555 [Candidatus Woesearchaeota archaeon]